MACSRRSPPSLSLTVSLSPFLCTLMYKIAPIHKQHHYFHCLPTMLSLSFPTIPSTLPLSLSHTLSILSKATFKVYFARSFFCGYEKRVENCGLSIASMLAIRYYRLKNDVWLTVTYSYFSYPRHSLSLPLFIVLSFCQTFHISVERSRDMKFWPNLNGWTMVHSQPSISL